jgi:chromosome partitioning protein
MGNGRRRDFSLAEAQEIVRRIGPYSRRPAGLDAVSLCVGNFKGGVGKTTLAVAIAQGLTLHGHRVLVIDLDPQASSTTLFGYIPDAEVEEDQTVMPIIFGAAEDGGLGPADLSDTPAPSYWDGIDLIPSAPFLFGADYALPNRQVKEPNFEFWSVLDKALAPLRKKYDVIVIDTPPTLSYLAVAAFMASDGMVVPIPPETLDYASSTQFFGQFSELFSSLRGNRNFEKTFAFCKIVLSKVKNATPATAAVRLWIQQTYPGLVANAEIPATDLVSNASAEFKTIYDVSSYEGSAKTWQRALAAFDGLVDELEGAIQRTWQKRKEH